MVSKQPLSEIEQEMVSSLLNVDDMNYAILCEPFVCERKSNSMTEIEMERVSYLLNLDDMNYSMLCEPLIRYRSDMAPDLSNIGGLEKISMISGLISKEELLGSMELMDTRSQMEFPKRKFHPLRPATLEDELAEDPSFSE